MPGFQSLAARALAQPPQQYADGGPVGFGARGLAGLRELAPKMAAMGYPQAAPAPAAAALAAPPRSPAGLRAVIPQVEAMGYQQAAAPVPQYFAEGGVVRGPGTGTSDSIEDEVPPESFIMPADSTQAVGMDAMQQLGAMPQDKVPVRLSDGETKIPPDQVMAFGAAVLQAMKDLTHTPVNGVDGGQTDAELAEPAGFAPGAALRMAAPPEQRFADGGLVDPARRPNSFGDAAAVARDPGVTQVNMGGADTFGRPAPAPAPRPAGFQSAATRMASTGDPTNPYAANNAAVLSNFAQQQGSRGIMEMGRAPAPAPLTARNSFGDAAAATVDPSTTQVAYRAGTPAPAATQLASVPTMPQPAGFAASARPATPAPAAAAPAAPMGWAERQAQRNDAVSAASITNRPEWSRAHAGLARRAYADGGLVDDEQRRLAQIPTGGQVAPVADGSQANPLNTEVGRNVVNTLSALPGATGLAARGGATAARAGGAVANTERAIPAAWEVVQDGGALASRATAPAAQQMAQLPGAGGPLARAANMAPQQAAPALAGPGGQVATAGPQAGQAARGAMEFVERVPDAAIGMSQTAAPAAQAASAGGAGLSRYATGAAGLGAAAMLAGATPDTGAAPTQPAGFAPNALAAPTPGSAPATAALGQMPGAAPAGITRQGNSYTGPANITGDVTINGAAPGGGAISAQNMAAADTLAGRQAQESAARVLGQMPAGFQPNVQAPVTLTTDNSWLARNNMRNAEVSAKSITSNGGRFDQTGGRNPAQAAYAAEIANDNAARAAGQRLTGQAMQETGANNRAALQQASETQREGIRAGALTLKAQIDARRTGQAPAGYQWTPNGQLQAITGGPADPNVRGSKAPLNDVQSKALQFGTRMQEAGSVIDRMATAGVTQPGLIKRGADAVGLGGLANFTQSAEQQQVEQAQRDFINAVLRRESGAAIADSEFANANKQYFIQPGDSPEVQAQKRRNREIATAGILAEVPDSEKRVGQVLQAANNNSPAQPAAAGAAPAAGTPVQVTDAASYQALPAGATYITPTGEVRRKK